MKNKAFSMVEALIVIAILGLFAAIVIPQFLKKKNPKMAGVLVKKEVIYEGWWGKGGWRTNIIHRIYVAETNSYDVTPAFYNMTHSNLPVYHE